MSGGISTFETMSARRRKDTPPGRVIPVQGVKDNTYMESFVSFFHDIGQAYSNTSQVEEKETILWARLFDFQSVLYPEFFEQLGGKVDNGFETVLLLLGYKNGIQGWIFEKNGDMHEIFSLRQGPVKTACLVPSVTGCDPADKVAITRPLLAVCMAADRKQLFTCVHIISLRTGDEVNQLKFENDIQELHMGLWGLLIIAFKHEVQVFDATNFNLVFTIGDCYQSTGRDVNPIAISKEWLAYTPAKPMPNRQSAGGMEDDGINSYTATVLSAAKTLRKGLVNIGETVNWLAKSSISGSDEPTIVSPRENMFQRNRTSSGGSLPELNEKASGYVTVLNVQSILRLWKHDTTRDGSEDRVVNGIVPAEAMVAHFPAHEEPIVCMEFSPCGSLLATADIQGHAFHVFSILPHPVNSKMGAVHHLYTLYRGDTSAKVLQFTFSHDCRWLCASTHRGTSHLFPVSTYGGPATIRTHVSHRVVNRSSLFHKSAGLEDLQPSGIGSGAVHNSLHGHNPVKQSQRGRPYVNGTGIRNSTNPRLPPHPQPTLVQPLAQIGAAWAPQVLNIPKITAQSNHSAKLDKSSTSNWQTDVVVATAFLSDKLQLSSSSGHDNAHRRTPISASSKGGQCLIIFTSTGQLTEYHFEPKPRAGLKRISEDSPIELIHRPKLQWSLQRSISWDEVTLPLQSKDPILEIDDLKRQQMQEKNDVSSMNIPPNLSVSSLKNSDVSEVEHGRVTTGMEDVPKTQLPLQRYTGSQTRCSSGGQYPGTAVSAGRTSSKHHIPLEAILSTSNHSDHALQTRPLPSRDDLDYVKGSLADDHRRTSNASDHRPSSGDSMRSDKSLKQPDYDEWLAQVEMVSHEGPARRLWMGPQFCFKLRQSTASTTCLSSTSSAMFSNRNQNASSGFHTSGGDGNSSGVGMCFDEDLDVRSLNIRPNQSEPVPTPAGSHDRYEPDLITIDAGSGHFDRASYMRDHCANFGSVDDRRSADEDIKLRERIAEAMQESDIAEAKARSVRSDSVSSDITLEGCADSLVNPVIPFEFDELEGAT